MLLQIAYYNFLGLPMIVYGGIFTFLMLIATITFGVLQKKQKFLPLSFKLHKIFSFLTLIAAIFHGGLGLLINI